MAVACCCSRSCCLPGRIATAEVVACCGDCCSSCGPRPPPTTENDKQCNENHNAHDPDNETRVWRYAHYSSYTPWASKRSVMISTLKKVNKMASNDENLVKSAYWKLKEFARLKYPIPALLRACSVVAVTTRNPAWFQVINTFKRHHTQTQTKTLRAYGGATERSEGRCYPPG